MVYVDTLSDRPGGSAGKFEKPSDDWVLGSNLGEVTRSGISPYTKLDNEKRLCRGNTKFGFTVDEGKGSLNPAIKGEACTAEARH